MSLPETKKRRASLRRPAAERRKPPYELVRRRPAARGEEGKDDGGRSEEVASFEGAFEGVVQLLRDAKRIVVLTGAGISVSCGIPDFRTKGSGLYSTLDAEALGLSCPEELFDYDVFLDNPKPFFQFARNLYYPLGGSAPACPSDSHRLLALLERRGKLLRVYSQNIDGLEEVAGVSAKKVVYAHGSLQYATCCKCKRKVPSAEIRDDIWNGVVARCRAALPAPKAKGKKNGGDLTPNSPASTPPLPTPTPPMVASRSSARKRLREADEPPPASLETSGACGGVMKPGVTFFGEQLNDNVRRCLEADRDKVDALVVMGTSLSVAPISKVVGYLPARVPRILINRTIVHPTQFQDASSDDEIADDHPGEGREHYVFDAYLLGYCDDVTRALAPRLFVGGAASDATDAIDPPDAAESMRLGDPPEGVLLACLKEEADDSGNGGDASEAGDVGGPRPRRQDWTNSKIAGKIPPDRIFLFSGAVPPSDGDGDGDSNPHASSTLNGSSSSSLAAGDDNDDVHGTAARIGPPPPPPPPRLEEVAHCDGCGLRIRGGIVHKCRSCFDYDLCPSCYGGGAVAKDHHGGSHSFVIEAVATGGGGVAPGSGR